MLRFWRFVSNKNSPGEHFSEIMLLVDQLNNTMATICTADRNISTDESMILWRIRLLFKQCIKYKRHPYGCMLLSCHMLAKITKNSLLKTGEICEI